MNNIFFIIFCTIFFLLGCSPNNFEKAQRSSSSDLWDDDEWGGNDSENNDSENAEIGEQVKNVCRNNQFTIYSPGDCPEIERSGDNNYEIIMDGIDFDADQDFELNMPPGRTLRPVDIFFVVNASASMWYYTSYVTSSNNEMFQNRFKSFIPTLDQYNLDWRMFFANADYSGGVLKGRNGKAMPLEGQYGVLPSKVLDKKIRDHKNILTYTITRGPDLHEEHGDTHDCSAPPYCGNVQPLRAIKASFSANKNLTRDEADFVAIIVSNRDEEKKKVTSKSVIEEFRKVYGQSKRLFVLNLIVLPGDSKCYEKNSDRTFFFFRYWQKPSYGTQISNLAKRTGGGNFSICMNDYSNLAKTIIILSSQQ